MSRCLAACMGVLVTFAAPAFAENQIWTGIELKKRSTTRSPVELTLNADVRFEPDGDADQYVLRPGMGIDLNKRLHISGGYRYAQAVREGPDDIEHRLWQQASYDLLSVGDAELSGRTRIEQRFREGEDDTGHRLRQQFSVSHPLGASGLRLTVSDEVILGLNDTGWGNETGLQENRARLQLEWTVGEIGWKAGYLNQYRNGAGGAPDDTGHHLEFGLSKSF